MRRYDAVLLDVDGTLVDSNDANAHAWVDAFQNHDWEVSFLRVRRLIGMGGDLLIETVTGLPVDAKESKRIAKDRSEIFRKAWLPKVTPLVGSRELVLRLRSEGYQFAIASAAQRADLQPLLEIANIADLCEHRTSSSEVEESKPNPDIVDAAIAKLSVTRGRAVMIGDTPYDVAATRAARVDIIGVTSGGWSVEGLAGAVAVFRGPADLVSQWAASPLRSL
jgi:phosphoglycolate phosphatase-like HAD superfamily hydrolase